jgi:N-hydroxyarylamine O-acetyltransferase
VLVLRVAAQLERTTGAEVLGGEGVGVVAAGAGDAGHAQPARGKLRRVAGEVPSRLALDDLIAGEPHDTAVVRVPVALIEDDVDDGAIGHAVSVRMTSEWDIEQLDLDAYLRRVGYDGDTAPTAATLAALHRAHLATVPFENLDIVLGRGISVDFADVQRKLVDGRRGGYCYEHGLLFAAALERLGFEVDRLLARVGGDGYRPRARTHMALRVRADDEPWLADVGFGSGLLEPLPFDGGEPRRQGGWEYALVTTGEGEWELREHRGDEWLVRYGFADERQHPADVVVANHYTSTWWRSPFVTRAVVVRKDEDALRELIDGTLTTTRPDGSTEERTLAGGELAATLEDVFRLPLSADEVTALARFIAAA